MSEAEPNASANPSGSERDSIFGLLAVQTGLVTLADLDDAVRARGSEPGRPIDEILIDRGALDTEAATAIGAIVRQHVRRHDGVREAAESLATTMPSPEVTETARTRVPADDGGSPDHRVLETIRAKEGPPTSSPRHEPVDAGGRFELVRFHARGGLGEVYVALDQELRREVALKRIQERRADDPDSRARFLLEAEVTGGLEHPGIVPIYGMGRDSRGRPYYAMRFIRGDSLKDAIEDFHKAEAPGRDPVERSLALRGLLGRFIDVCDAIEYTHSRGVLHRDIKPANVMLGPFGETLVVDWGIAKILGRPEPAELSGLRGMSTDSISGSMTEPGSQLGTPAYMSPEQFRGDLDKIGPPSDVYSLGATLYHLLAGRPTIERGRLHEIASKVEGGEIATPRQVKKDVPPALEAVCLRAMSVRAGDRYPSARALAEDLEHWLADEPVSAYREPWPVRLGRWGRRHRTAVAGAVGLLAAAVAALAIGGVLVGRERDEARLQRQQARRAVDDMYTEVAEKWLEDRLDPLQHRFLTRALDYYERFAGRDAPDPAVRQERGRAYLRMGDILRKLGRPAEAEAAYRASVEILGRLADDQPSVLEHRLVLAHTLDRLGLVLADKNKFADAEPLYRRAVAIQEPPAAVTPAGSRVSSQLARSHKDLADLLRATARFPEAEASYRRAIERLGEPAPDDVESRQDLAAAHDRLGLLLKENGRFPEAGAAYGRALERMEALAAEFPTLPRLRETLSRALGSMGLFLQDTGHDPEAVAAFVRARDVADLLARDFPGRPEYRRDLAKACANLAQNLARRTRLGDAEPQYRRALGLYEALVAEVPDVLQYRQDLGRTSNNLGLLLRSAGRLPEAEAASRRAVAIYEALAREVPDRPEFRQALATYLRNLGLLLAATGRSPDAEVQYRRAEDLYRKLADDYPGVPGHRLERAKTLGSLALLLRTDGRKPDAGRAYREAVAIARALAADDPGVPEYRRELAQALNGLAGLRPPDAEPSYREALALAGRLAADQPDDPGLRQFEASISNNLGELPAELGRTADAEAAFRRAVVLFERSASGPSPTAADRTYLAYTLGKLAALRLGLGDPAEARPLLERAVAQQRLVGPRGDAMRDHLAALARVLLATGDHDGAARLADELPAAVPDPAAGALESARLLARCAALAEADPRLPAPSRRSTADAYSDRAIARLRAAPARDGPGRARLADDPELAPLRSRPAFEELLKAPEPAPGRRPG